ncbi:unnamed protein product [Prorocentrum cordatum]|uniref:Uncharacterized protein n=1 Tax=Prorocentrum cordatum TaxID=2364126 RepID=A0ABN9UCM1_9DINO|nr:unnamed protein product [Polarella glacialis]
MGTRVARRGGGGSAALRARAFCSANDVFSPGLHPRRLPEGLQEEARARDCDAGRRTAAPAPEPSEAARAQPFCRRSLCPRGLRRRRSRGRRLSASGAFAREDSAAAPPRSMQSSTRDVFCLFLADSVLSCRLRGPRMARPTR